MRHKTLLLVAATVLLVIIVCQVLISFKLDISLFSQQSGYSMYDNSKISSSGLHRTKAPSMPNLRSGSSEPITKNTNPFIPANDVTNIFNAVGIKAEDSVVKGDIYKNLFSGNDFVEHIKPEKEMVEGSRQADGKLQIGGIPTAVIILTYNRPQLLLQTYTRIAEVLKSSRNKYSFALFISQDGENESIKKMIDNIETKIRRELTFIPFGRLSHTVTKFNSATGYHSVAHHIKFALDYVIVKSHFQQVIVIDDDIQIADDFFEYMSSASVVIQSDTTLIGASAWNENGQPEFILDSKLVLRSDFMSGGAWMITSSSWSNLRLVWPSGYWNDWIHLYTKENHLAWLRPEISRIITIGESGINKHSYYWNKQKTIILNSNYVMFSSLDFSYLLKSNFDTALKKLIDEAVSFHHVSDLITVPSNKNAKILYSKEPSSHDFFHVAQQLGIASDYIQGIPPTAYMGVVIIEYHGIRLFVVPESGPSFDY